MKTAIILYNLGGPDTQAAVKPFLFNLFNDPAILRLPTPLRCLLAWLISKRREKTAQEIYQKMGGGSPIFANTQAQARALEAALSDLATGPGKVKCFIAMRYWHPFTADTVRAVKEFAPDRIVQLPLYPQFSTTTTASSLREAARTLDTTAPIKTVCCYPAESGFITGLAANIRTAFEQASAYGTPRLLLSAHGLPEKIVRAGDPYQWQCEQTAQALVKALNIPGLDWSLCYQSRVGPLQWIGPSTESEVDRAAADKKPLVIAPIAFVSEHSETLVELGMDCRARAIKGGVPFYAAVPTVSINADFVAGLAKLVRKALASNSETVNDDTGRICPQEFCGCGWR